MEAHPEPEQVARPGAELGLDMTQRAHDDRSGRPPRRARRALQSQALGEGHRRVIPAMDQEERGAEPTEMVLGRERGQELAHAGWKLGHEAVKRLGVAVVHEATAGPIHQLGIGASELCDGGLVDGPAPVDAVETIGARERVAEQLHHRGVATEREHG